MKVQVEQHPKFPGGIRLTVVERCELHDWKDACVDAAIKRVEAVWREQVRQLELAEEGAKEVFAHVVLPLVLGMLRGDDQAWQAMARRRAAFEFFAMLIFGLDVTRLGAVYLKDETIAAWEAWQEAEENETMPASRRRWGCFENGFYGGNHGPCGTQY